MSEYKGIYCHVVWNNEDPQYFYISFGDYDYDNEPKTDSYGVDDELVFYYLTKEEQRNLLTAIVKQEETFQLTPEWHIDFVMGYELETV